MNDAYKDWMHRVVGGREAKPLATSEQLKFASDEPISVINYTKQKRAGYAGEVAKKGDDFIYHFYPSDEIFEIFGDALGDAFLVVFKLEDRLEASYVPEFKSWDVKASGFAVSPLAESLALKVFDVLDAILE
jgi:hypothetical protein